MKILLRTLVWYISVAATVSNLNQLGPSGGDQKDQCPEPDGEHDRGELNSFLWAVKREPPAYFFGTIHVPYTRVWDYIPANTKRAFQISKNIFFELDLTDPYTISSLTNCQMLPQGENLGDILPRSMYLRLKSHLEYVRVQMPKWMTADQKGKGIYADYLFNAIAGNWERKRPIWVMLLVNSLTEADIRSRGVPVLDLYLAKEAERLDKRTGAVERVEEQCVPLNALNFSQVLFALNHTLWQQETIRNGELDDSYSTEDLIRHYNCGDLNSVIFKHDTAQVPNIFNSSLTPADIAAARRIDEYFREELIYKRNNRMASRVKDLLEAHPQKSFFFAFGAGHFLGNNTVIDILRNYGYEISHVTPEEDIKKLRKKWQLELGKDEFSMQKDDVTDGDISTSRLLQRLERLEKKQERRKQRKEASKKDKETGQNSEESQFENSDQQQFNDLWVKIRPEPSVPHQSDKSPEEFFDQSAGSFMIATSPTSKNIYYIYLTSGSQTAFLLNHTLLFFLTFLAILTNIRIVFCWL